MKHRNNINKRQFGIKNKNEKRITTTKTENRRSKTKQEQYAISTITIVKKVKFPNEEWCGGRGGGGGEM